LFYEWGQVWLYTAVPTGTLGTRYPITPTLSSAGPEAIPENNTHTGEIMLAELLFLPVINKSE
jgi:hypothetical protein